MLLGYPSRSRMKLYASPNGMASMTAREGTRCNRRPLVGDPHGQLEAQKRGNGSIPSFASSWLTRACANVMVMMLPKAEIATSTLFNICCFCQQVRCSSY